MPRTTESLVDNHRAATERRNAGKPIWDHRIRIRHLVQGQPDVTTQEVGKQIATILRASTWAKADQKDAAEGGGDSEVIMCAEEFEDAEDDDHFRAILDRLYDLADADRTWIE